MPHDATTEMPVVREDRPPEGPEGGAPPPGRPWYRRNRWLLAVLAAVALVVGVIGIAFASIYAGADIPSPEELALPEPSVVYDATGTEVATLDPGAIEANVAIGDLPPHVPAALLAAEDRDFFEHGGFSTTGILRAAWANLTSGEVVQGASTIHQQYVSIAIAEIDDSFTGKFREVAVAAKLDDELSKERILEMYLNAVPFGRGVRGIEAAARTYFDKPAVELDVNEAATLAGIIAAPSAYDPEDNPDAATARRDYVLRGMVETGALEAAEAEQLIAASLPETRQDPLVQHGDDAYFLDAVRDLVPEHLEDPGVDPYRDLAIHTTLDRRLQRTAILALREQLAETEHSGALVTVVPGNGAVRALVGGLDYATQEFNVAVEGSRQAGSSFKPFALAAFVDDGGSPESPVDAPRVLDVPDGNGGEAEIYNYTQRGYGRTSLRQATIQSMNTAYVNLATELGYDVVAETANRLGIESELPEVPTTVLGTGGVNPLEMASAYATLAGGGVHHEAHLVTRIETLDGELLYEREDDSEQVIDTNTAAVVTDVLAEAVSSGTGTAAALEDHPVAGKTGTTNDYRDAWFVGYTPQLATAVWVGNLDNTPMDRVTGGSFPALAWADYMGQALQDVEPAAFPEPDTSVLEVREIDGVTSPDRATETETERETAPPSPAPEPTETTSSEPEPTPSEPTEPEPTTTGSATEGEGTEQPSEPQPTSTEPSEPAPSEPEPTTSEQPSEQPSEGSSSTEDETLLEGSSDGSSDSSSEDTTTQQSSSEESTTEPSPSSSSTTSSTSPSPSETTTSSTG